VSFDALEVRTNAAVMRRLSNARAFKAPANTNSFPVIFDQDLVESTTGATVSAAMPSALDADVADLVPHESLLTIKGVEYIVRDKRPDGSGFTVLVLEVA
jgi:hypothetical protein